MGTFAMAGPVVACNLTAPDATLRFSQPNCCTVAWEYHRGPDADIAKGKNVLVGLGADGWVPTM